MHFSPSLSLSLSSFFIEECKKLVPKIVQSISQEKHTYSCSCIWYFCKIYSRFTWADHPYSIPSLPSSFPIPWIIIIFPIILGLKCFPRSRKFCSTELLNRSSLSGRYIFTIRGWGGVEGEKRVDDHLSLADSVFLKLLDDSRSHLTLVFFPFFYQLRFVQPILFFVSRFPFLPSPRESGNSSRSKKKGGGEQTPYVCHLSLRLHTLVLPLSRSWVEVLSSLCSSCEKAKVEENSRLGWMDTMAEGHLPLYSAFLLFPFLPSFLFSCPSFDHVLLIDSVLWKEWIIPLNSRYETRKKNEKRR